MLFTEPNGCSFHGLKCMSYRHTSSRRGLFPAGRGLHPSRIHSTIWSSLNRTYLPPGRRMQGMRSSSRHLWRVRSCTQLTLTCSMSASWSAVRSLMLSPPCDKRRERRLEKGTAFYSIVYVLALCMYLLFERRGVWVKKTAYGQKRGSQTHCVRIPRRKDCHRGYNAGRTRTR